MCKHPLPSHMYMHEHVGYRLVIVCSSQDKEKSPIISKLHLYRRPYGVSTDTAKYRAYLRSHFVDEKQPHYQQLQEAMGYVPNLTASVVDINRCVYYTCIMCFYIYMYTYMYYEQEALKRVSRLSM